MNLFRKSLATLLGCALFATTALVADAGLVSQATVVLVFAGAASVGAIADESPRFLEVDEIVKSQRDLQEDSPTPAGVNSVAPTAAPSSAPDAPTNGGAGMFVGGGASKAAISCALASLAGGAMAAAV